MNINIFSAKNFDRVCLVGTVISSVNYQFHRNNLNSLTFNILVDGEVIKVIIFNRKYLQHQIKANTKVMVSGKYNYFK